MRIINRMQHAYNGNSATYNQSNEDILENQYINDKIVKYFTKNNNLGLTT